MRTPINKCDWCKEEGPYKSLHRVTAKECCAGNSDRDAFHIELCDLCGKALRDRDGEAFASRFKPEP